MTSVFIREIKERNQTHGRKGSMKTEAVMQPQVQECRWPAKSGRGKEQFSSRPPEKAQPCQILNLQSIEL